MLSPGSVDGLANAVFSIASIERDADVNLSVVNDDPDVNERLFRRSSSVVYIRTT
jgi:hypothetical protein